MYTHCQEKSDCDLLLEKATSGTNNNCLEKCRRYTGDCMGSKWTNSQRQREKFNRKQKVSIGENVKNKRAEGLLKEKKNEKRKTCMKEYMKKKRADSQPIQGKRV